MQFYEKYSAFFGELGFDELLLAKLQKYAGLLKAWNQKVNITGQKADDKIFFNLISDTLIGWHTVKSQNVLINRYKIADIGAGGGIAGIPIALTNPEYNVCLIESNKKKCMVLEDIKEDLPVRNISIIQCRAETAGRDIAQRECYDVVVAKAVSALSVLAELAFPLLKVGGVLVAYKGKSVSEEIALAKQILCVLNGEIIGCYNYSNPMIKNENTAIIISKNAKTGDEFPRRIGTAQKRPIN